MTLEERERHAYADGRIVEALLLATAIDWESDRLKDCEWELETLNARIGELGRELNDA